MYIDYTILVIYVQLDNLIFTATLQGIVNFLIDTKIEIRTKQKFKTLPEALST